MKTGLRHGDEGDRVDRDHFFMVQETEESPECYEMARSGFGGQAVVAEMDQVAENHRRPNVGESGDRLIVEIGPEIMQIAAVGFQRVGGQSFFDGQVDNVAVDPLILVGETGWCPMMVRLFQSIP